MFLCFGFLSCIWEFVCRGPDYLFVLVFGLFTCSYLVQSCFMVRYKRHANYPFGDLLRRKSRYPRVKVFKPCGPDCKMARPRNKRPVVKSTPTLRLDPGTTLITKSGMWRDVDYYYVAKDPGLADDHFFRDLTVDYTKRQHPGHPDPYNKEEMDALFGDKDGVNQPCGKVKPVAAVDNIDEIVRAAFHLDEAFEWRWPNEEPSLFEALEVQVYTIGRRVGMLGSGWST